VARPFAAAVTDDGDAENAMKRSRPGSWVIIALLIAIGVAAMVIMTLK
jgi:hypothetical protein